VYLHDLVETTHEFLKLLEEHINKVKHVFVQRRRAARKSNKSKKKKSGKVGQTAADAQNEPPNEQLQNQWDNEIVTRLTRLLQGLDELAVDKADVCPFDALSEVPVDDQRLSKRR
jgi:hypothetical protein